MNETLEKNYCTSKDIDPVVVRQIYITTPTDRLEAKYKRIIKMADNNTYSQGHGELNKHKTWQHELMARQPRNSNAFQGILSIEFNKSPVSKL